ncbi:MAG: helix-turn-helix domain-containing protein [Nocardioidaceae bacterium]|nr:helix-turn-helix domain-containing protein [Nocardioidaceae bacterium]
MDRLLTLPEVAAMLRTPPDTLRYWRHIGAGPRSGKVGRRIIYRERDVLAYLDEQLGTCASLPGREPHGAPSA